MNKKNETFVDEIRGLEIDHLPDGYPAIKMKDISRLCDIIEMASKYLFNVIGYCPAALYYKEYNTADCENMCCDNIEYKCWINYLSRKCL